MSESDVEGVCIGANVEVGRGIPLQPGQIDRQRYLGINIQPRPATRGVTAIQIQNVETLSEFTNLEGVPLTFGSVDGVKFCMVFVPARQELLFLRNCGSSSADIVARLDMNWKPGLQTTNATARKPVSFAEHAKAMNEHEQRRQRAQIDMLLGSR